MILMCCMFQRGLIPQAKETGDPDILVCRCWPSIYVPYDTDVLHVSAGTHTASQGDPGDPEIVPVPGTCIMYTRCLIGTPSLYQTDVLHVSAGLIPRAKETLVTLIYLYTDATSDGQRYSKMYRLKRYRYTIFEKKIK